MAGGIDWSKAQVVPEPDSSIDWSKATVVADQPSFLSKAAGAMKTLAGGVAQAATGKIAGDAASEAVDAIDHNKTLNAADQWIQNLGNVEIPDAQAPGGKRKVQAFDTGGAANLGLAMGLSPLLGPEIVGGAATLGDAAGNAAELALKLATANAMSKRLGDVLQKDYPSKTLSARFIKWAADQGVQTIPFMMGGGMANRLKLRGELLGEDKPEPGAEPDSPSEKFIQGTPEEPSAVLGLASKLTPKPEREPAIVSAPPGAAAPEPIDFSKAEIVEEAPTPTPAAEKPAEPTPAPAAPKLEGATNLEKLESADKTPIPDERPLSPEGTVLRALEDMPAGKVRNIPTSMINTDPERFQYKLNTDREGAGRSLMQAGAFNENLAGAATGYYDPEDDKLYIVNGHQRLALAKRTDYPAIPMRVIDGGNSLSWAAAHNASPEAARSHGALQNIAERSVVNNEADAVDAAQWLRDQHATVDQLKAVGLDLSGKILQQATALQNLSDNLFHWVKSGDLDTKKGVVIGQELAGKERLQDEVFRWLRGKINAGKTVSNDVLREFARDAADSPDYQGEEAQLGFGGDFGDLAKRSLWEERSTVMSALKNRIASERSTFGNAARNREALEGAGNVLTDENAARAAQAEARLRLLNSNARKDPAIQHFLNTAARELAENPRGKNAIVDRAYENITTAADEALATAKAEGPPQPELAFAGHDQQGGALFKDPQTGQPLTGEQAAKKTREPGFSLNAGLPGVPQLAEIIEPQVRQVTEAVAKGGRALNDTLRYTFAPQMRSNLAKRGAGIIIEARGEQAMHGVQAEAAIAPLRAPFETIPEDRWRERFAAAAPYQRGEHPEIIPDELRPVMEKVRAAYAERRETANRLRAERGKRPIADLDNYLTQLWADSPEKVREAFAKSETRFAGRPLTRGTPFIHERHYMDYEAGMAAGLTPLFKNPADMWIYGLRQYDAYIAAETMFRNLSDAGLLRFFRMGTHEEGWSKVPDSFFRVMQPTPEGMVERGDWRMPDEVSTVFDKHLTPSVAQKDKGIGGVIMRRFGPGSGIAHFNAFRVGFSSFHFLNTINSAMAQLQGTGIARLLTGAAALDAREMGNGLKIAGKGLIPELGPKTEGISEVHQLFVNGDKIMRAMVDPGTQGAEWDAAAEAAATGGMRVKPEQLGTLSDVLSRAMKEVIHPFAEKRADEEMSTVGKALKLPFREAARLADLSSTGLMNYYVPRVKLGAYYKLLDQEMAHYTARSGGEIPWALQREIMQNVSAHVDSLFGQMVGDNLFMSRSLKDLMHVGIAYPGWNIGSLRLMLKAAQGAGRAITFQSLDSQQRLALQFTFGMLTSQAVEGAMLNRMLTGAWPKSVQDFYQPRDGGQDAEGNPTRISGPTYMRTYLSLLKGVGAAQYERGAIPKAYAVGGGAVDWALNISNPLWGSIHDLIDNKDHWTGVQIFDPHAPMSQNFEQFGDYVFKKVLPFSFTNVEQLRETGKGGTRAALGAVGFTPTPAQWLRTPAENYIMKLEAANVPQGAVTDRQHDLKQAQRALEDALQTGKPMDPAHLKALKGLSPELRSKVTEDAVKETFFPGTRIPRPRIMLYMQRLPLHQVLETYRIAQDTGDEKNLRYAKGVILHKAANMTPEKWEDELGKLNPSDQEYYRGLLQKVLHPEAPTATPAGPET